MKSSRLVIAAVIAATQLFVNQPVARAGETAASSPSEATPVPEKAPPLPLHTIEGVGGLVITPVAYLVDPGPEGTWFGRPSFSATYVSAHQQNVSSFDVTETLFRRVELGFAASRFGLGDLPTAVEKAVGADIGRSDVWLYNLNARVLALPENSFNLPTPSVTLGVQGKINDGIGTIDHNTGGALTKIGLRHTASADFVGTATKMFPNVIAGHPFLISAGLRLSEADQLGYVGFGDTYRPSFEGNAAYAVLPWAWLAFEYRQKRNPYGHIGDLVRPEQDWFTTGVAFILNNHTTATAGYGHLGNVLNRVEDYGWALSAKYEF